MAGKSDSTKTDTLKEKVYAIIESSKNAITEEELAMRMSNVDKTLRVEALNMLRTENKIKFLIANNKISYELVLPEQSPDDIVLSVIKESGRNGIWVREIRYKSKLSQIILNKAIKSLENKKLIRSIKSISNRKLYVLYELEPDDSITGGACYDSGYIREDIVKNLKSTCFQYLYDRFQESYQQMIANIHSVDDQVLNCNNIYASASEVFEHFAKRNIFQDIKLGDIEQILNILSFECKLKKKVIADKALYRYNPYNRDKTDMFYAPCMVCHLFKDCKPGAVNVSPENCHYLSIDKF